ncbi:TetR/AcrR family transcriptional regulator [Corynebacterium diphtheriae]|uniref:TetR/AcrR family transcriptional regulator n=1 Tax=Corynebacterium diphtheriae TaxID=1717 RepID=A0A811G2F8_CORDP|nr:TetR/AcrR family transcriptional regulator [Corynebacterium diphtheriae]MBG9220825.1 TetR/AcrR family transcriptional regulator [Corynebacterium diphtheriae bv. mitis]MBG9300412.1 TetR/AcrR family transcriptional regulator [Corynebacterium diphtheriae bv. mitis]RKW80187.1 TetR/AcrR family transcriptional regulator [Corynebacterium diphtheriae]RKW85703.1 TetR/AcrR family transcriptional regulator [Corynebacterium diphtheriae]RKW89674.1 TetR/AcrR family transcriptional regulator [Corynebacter
MILYDKTTPPAHSAPSITVSPPHTGNSAFPHGKNDYGELKRNKKDRNQKALAHATASLVVEAGLDAATVSAIAQRAGVSQRTFHNYFNSREEALVTFTFECITALVDDMTLLPDDWSLYRKTEAVVLKHLEKDEADPVSLYSISTLSEHLHAHATQAELAMMNENRHHINELVAKIFPDLDPFTLRVQLAIASAVASTALKAYFEQHGVNNFTNPEAAKKLVTTAFDQLRTMDV